MAYEDCGCATCKKLNVACKDCPKCSEEMNMGKSYESDDEEMDKWDNVQKACWVGYEQRGMKEKGGRMVPNCVPVGKSDESESEDVDNQIEKASTERLKELVDAYNKNKEGNKRISVGTLQAVYRRGIGAYRTNPGSVRPNVSSPQQWAMGRVNAFMAGLRGRFPSKPFDLDLFPKGHPRATKKSLFEDFAKDVDKPTRVKELFDQSNSITKNTDNWGGSIFDLNPFKK